MATPAACWEWRTFGPNLGPAEAEILACAEPARLTDEIYLVSGRPDVNVKIRERVLDIKKLEAVDASGLELWSQILQAPFPLDVATMRTLCALWHADCPELDRTHYTLTDLLELVALTTPAVTTVNVSKRRRGGVLDGCVADLADLVIGGGPVRTAGLQSEDPAQLLTTVRRLGLDCFENVNYVKAIQRAALANPRQLLASQEVHDAGRAN